MIIGLQNIYRIYLNLNWVFFQMVHLVITETKPV